MIKNENGLTALQQRFAEEFLIDVNGAAAYKRAGGNVKSDEAAAVNAARLLRNAKVQKVIRELMAARSEATKVDTQKVVDELAKIAFADPRRFLTWDEKSASLVPSVDLTDADAGAIRNLKTKTTTREVGGRVESETVLEISFHDKNRALELLGKHTGGFVERIEKTEERKRVPIREQIVLLPETREQWEERMRNGESENGRGGRE